MTDLQRHKVTFRKERDEGFNKRNKSFHQTLWNLGNRVDLEQVIGCPTVLKCQWRLETPNLNEVNCVVPHYSPTVLIGLGAGNRYQFNQI